MRGTPREQPRLCNRLIEGGAMTHRVTRALPHPEILCKVTQLFLAVGHFSCTTLSPHWPVTTVRSPPPPRLAALRLAPGEFHANGSGHRRAEGRFE
ncbi:hypothetical protein BaRGS_00016223 [Batillaria attramentaria]|uniref:Uncharacterized protein n=1 Tax=Batillaria attramentaria TaxID=370345 RepID=A0ABD0KZA9_9CAEN